MEKIITSETKNKQEILSDLTENEERLFNQILTDILSASNNDDLDAIELTDRTEEESERLGELTEAEKEKLESLKELHKRVISGKKVINNEDSANADYDKLKNRLDKFRNKWLNDSESFEGWIWDKYNLEKAGELEKFYQELLEKNNIVNRLKRIRIYGSENAELYMLYTRVLKRELPEYIEKVKEELGAKFVRFNQFFKKSKGESFGDFVVRKVTNVENFYFQPDRVWKEIEDGKEEVFGQILSMAPTIQYQSEVYENNVEEVVKESYYDGKEYKEKGIVYENKSFLWKISKEPKESLPSRLYNIKAQKIERKYEEGIKNYAILSYVWGKPSKLPKELEKKLSNIWEEVGYKNKLNSSGYKALYKAIETCKLLGIDYLWMDQLCTNQGDNEDKNREVPKMREYYSNSSITLTSTDGKLRGDDKLLPSLPDTLKKIVNSEWFTRSWTFQEGWLSKQTIYMFDDELVDGRAVAQTWVLNQPVYTKFARYNSLEEAAEAAKKIATPLGWTYYKGKYDSEDKVDLSLGQVLKEIKCRGRGAPIDGIYSILGLLPYGSEVKVDYKPRICKGCCLKKGVNFENYKQWGIEVKDCELWGIEAKDCNHEEENKKWPVYTKQDITKALYEVMKTAIVNGYGEPFAWHGESIGLMPEVINEKGSTDMRGGLMLVCKCNEPHKVCEKCEQRLPEKHDHDYGCAKIKDVIRNESGFVSYGNVEVKGSKYVMKSVAGSEIVGIEESKGFLIEGGLHKREISIENVGGIVLTGSKETLNSMQENDLLIVLDKDKWESESPFAILVARTEKNDDIYYRKGIVGFEGKSEVEKLEKLGKKKESLIIDNEYTVQIVAIEEVEEKLKSYGLSEKILGAGWKFSFRGKVKEKIDEEKRKLLDLMEWFKSLTSLNPSEDYEFVLWLKNQKKLTVEVILNKHNLTQLKEEYKQEQLEAQIQVRVDG